MFANRRFQISAGAKYTAGNLFSAEESKPTLDKIDPRSTGWCEMEMEARPLHQPALGTGSSQKKRER